MQDKPRSTGIDVIGDVPWSTHFCQFYQAKEDMLDILVPYFKAGLENNEAGMWVTSAPLSVEEATEALSRAVPGLAKYLASGQMEIIPHTEWCLKDGSFDPQCALNGWVTRLELARARGFDGLRVTGNTAWLEEKDWNSFIEYEATVNRVIGNYKIIALCTYALDRCNANRLIDILRNHEFALMKREGKWELIENTPVKKAQESLRASEERYRNIVETANEGVITIDTGGIITFVNQKMADMLGYPREQLVGQSGLFLMDKDQQALAIKAREQVAQGRQIRDEWRFQRSDGSVLWTLINGSPLYDSAGHYIGNLSMHTDITERKKLEENRRNLLKQEQQLNEELQTVNVTLQQQGEILLQLNQTLEQSEERYRTLFDTMTEGFAFCEIILDNDGKPYDFRYLESNEALINFLELERDQVIGKTVRELVANPDAYAIAVYGRVALTGEAERFEYYNKRVKKWFELYVYSPKKGYFARSMRDITGRNMVEEALRESRERLTIATEASGAGIFDWDIVNDKIFWSPSVYEFYGLDPSEPMSFQKSNALRLVTDGERVQREFQEAQLHHDERWETEFRVQHPTKGVRWIAAYGRIYYDQDGLPVRMIGIDIDITEKKRTEEALIESEAKANALIKYAPSGIYEIDFRTGKFLSVNDAMSAISGYTREELFSLGPAALLDEESQKLFADRARRQLAGEIVDPTVEYKVKKKDGSYIFVNLNVSFSKVNPNTVFVIGHDITARKKAEVKLAYLASFPEQNPNPVLELDGEGNVIYQNTAVKRLFPGLSREGKRHPFLGGWKATLKSLGKANASSISREIGVDDVWYVQTISRVPSSENIRIYARDTTERKEAEEALRQSQHDLNRAQEVAETGSWRLDVRRNQLSWSDETYRIFGIAAGTPMTYDTFLEHILPADRGYVDSAWQAALRGEPYDIEHRIVVGNDVKWVREKAELELDKSGSLLNGFGTVQDITDRKQTEEELRETSDYLNNLLDYANAPIIVWNPEFEITRFNHAFERITGRTAGEVLGKKLGILFPDNSRKASMELIRKTLAGERWEVVEIPISHRNGTVRIVLWNSATLYTPGTGTAIATIAQGQDITDRKRAEEELHETSDYLNNLLDYANAPIIVWDPEFRITLFNHAFEQLAGSTEDEILGKHLSVLFPEDSRERSMRYIHRALTGEHWEAVEIPILRIDGTVRTVLWNSSTLYTSQGKTPVATIAQGQDITERKVAEEELKKRTIELEATNKELEAFSYSVSHDLRAPLRTLAGFSQALLEDYSEKIDGTGKDYINRIQAASKRMGILIDDLLSLSRVTRSELRWQLVNLSEVAAAVIDDLKREAPQRQVSVDIAPGLLCQGDVYLLRLVLENLLGNAWKFTGKCPHAIISFGSKRENGREVYFIRDNGAGFDMTYANKLFQPFQRLHSADEFSGSGIGLATVQRIIRRLGGRVWGEGNIGEGATFYFTLGE